MSSDYVKSIRPGKYARDATIYDVCSYKSSTSSLGMLIIEFKVNLKEEWRELSDRIGLGSKEWVPLFKQRFPLTAIKYNDLQSMKPVMSASIHPLFDNLPTE